VKRWLLLAAFATACNVNPYDLVSGGSGSDDGGIRSDSGFLDDGAPIPDARPIDATPPDACLPSPEVCDNKDNDCNGVVDNGFDLTQDPNNCGSCGNACNYTNRFGLCSNSACTPGACKPGFHDLDSNPLDCEYFCIETNGGTEVCDNIDNNCDGTIDDGFNTQNDTDNCGSCGNICNLNNATPTCNSGKCQIQTCTGGFVDVNGDPTDGCEYQCTKTNGGVEKCDGVDNDCNGMVDDGNPGGGASCGTDTGECTAGTTTCSFGVLFCVGQTVGSTETCNNLDDDCDGTVDNGFNKVTDPTNCGACGNICSFPNAGATCANSMCKMGTCTPGFFDINKMPGDGCEYACTSTGAERCNGIDDDCDGVADNGFNTQTDVNNCGACGNVCSFPNAGATCSTGTCHLGTCAANFYDIDGNPNNGCEYGCIKTNGGVEICDGVDNDCNGVIDNGNPGGGVNCGTSTGECDFGTTACVGGSIQCQGGQGPVGESCDSKDNDCNGVVDNGFDKLNDPRYCNNCAGCNLDHAVAGCSNGSCTIAGCLSGYVDADGLPGNGCEYFCTKSGAEVCDGKDNDCDTKTDETLTQPANFCKTAGECAGTTPSCGGAAGWVCNYTDPDVEKVNGNLVLEETKCDGKDNDCDGAADEPYPLKNTACGEDGTFGTTKKLGECRGTGTLICNGQQNGLTCNVTTAGKAQANESCDNKDNDCDGHVDEPYDASGFNGVRDAVVGPLTINGKSVVMYKYEASRPDADNANMGIVQTRACSTNNKIPWAGSTFAQAQAACSAAGMRLCKVTRDGSGNITSDEWGRFCAGSGGRVWPYGNTFGSTTCNGSAYDPVPGGVNEDISVATGSLSGCISQDAALDMSGNLKEYTDDARVAGTQTVYTLRGGSFDNNDSQNSPSHALGCSFDLTVVPSTYQFSNTGFRCCELSCAAGQVECGGTCKNLATDATNCGACGNACANGSSCQNGYCCPAGTMLCPGTDQCKASCP